jgi:hypothetical protein
MLILVNAALRAAIESRAKGCCFGATYPKSLAGLSRKNLPVQDNLDLCPGPLKNARHERFPEALACGLGGHGLERLLPMLESARRQGASIFVYLIFCLLIAIFVINFGPQKGSQGGGCSGASNVVVSVDGQEATQSSYHVAYANGYNRGNGKQKTYVALETIIRREILAQEAEARGMRVDSDLIQDQIKQGWFFLGGQRVQIPGIFDENHFWNLKAFKGWYSSMNVSRNSYVGEQARGLMASVMAEMLRDSVQVSREEALQHYLFENNTVQYDVVAFKPDAYKAAMKLTDADVERFLSTHAAEVEARYKTDERVQGRQAAAPAPPDLHREARGRKTGHAARPARAARSGCRLGRR